MVAVALDELEAFADTYGFVVRDDVLRAVALMIRNIVDEEGGEEPFVGQLTDTVLFLVTTPDCAQRVRDRLEARLKEALVFFYPRVDWETGQDQAGNPTKVFEKFEIAQSGSMNPKQYDAAMRDLVNFMTYVGEPARMQRESLGWKVMLFLFILFILSYLLKKEYWKDIH